MCWRCSLQRGLMGQTALKWWLDGQMIEPQRVRTDSADGTQDAMDLVWVNLPQPQYGPCQLEVQYRVPLPDTTADRRVAVPLIMPAQNAAGLRTELAGSSLVVQSTGVAVSLAPVRAGRATTIRGR